MERRALIVYCDNTPSGPLPGPSHDFSNYVQYLTSPLGGAWYSSEILGLHNPTAHEVTTTGCSFLNEADYSFVIFTGHGYILKSENSQRQYLELADKDISIRELKSSSPRQLFIIDACRGYQPITEGVTKIGSALESFQNFTDLASISRNLFDESVLAAERGLTVLYAASENESALDTDNGAAYLLSLRDAAKQWRTESNSRVLPANQAHSLATNLLEARFGDDTEQQPTMNKEKRLRYFPFAVNPWTIVNFN